MPKRPRVFVASSKEAEKWALAVQGNLEDDAEVTVWSQDAFRLGRTTVDELIRNLERSEFGVFIFSPQDEVTIRGRKLEAVRDNVILELGMFMGRLGKEKSFILKPKDTPDMRLPTDLLGVVTGHYDATRDNMTAGLGTACRQIKAAINEQLGRKSAPVDQLVRNALETVCRAMSVPVTPEKASLRAFIFRKEDEELVCRHFWDPNPSAEEIGTTRFKINKQTASRIVVVRCFTDNEMRSTTKSKGPEVKPIPKGFQGVNGEIDPKLRYVLATPIRKDSAIWGVVDFDASNRVGTNLLQTDASKTVIIRLAEHLASVLS